MKALWAFAAVGLSLVTPLGSASAQPREYWYRGSPDHGYEERGPRYRERDDWYEERPRYRSRRFAFSEREYLRCNPDVRQAVRRGQFESGWAHYQIYGQHEDRSLRC
jgi:hypothetical protein